MPFKRLSIAAAALLLAGGAQAAVITQSFGLPLTESTTEISQFGNFNLFDSNLGTLTGATLDLFGSATFSFTGQNVAVGNQVANLTSSTELFWSSSLAALAPLLTPGNFSLSYSSGRQVFFAGAAPRAFGPVRQTDSETIDLTPIIGALSAPGGGGPFTLGCDSLSGFTVLGGGGNIHTTQATAAACGWQLTYAFTPAPPPPPPPPPAPVSEPASLALVGLALAGLGLVARRRRSV